MSHPTPQSTRTADRQGAVVSLRAPVPIASVQGTLALELTPRLEQPQPSPSQRPSRLRAVRDVDAEQVSDDARDRIHDFVRSYLQAVLEIVAGDRPASQVVRHTRADVHQDLTRRAVLVARAGGHALGGGRPDIAIRPQIRSCHTSLVRKDAVEASIHVRYRERSRAVAARFEVRRNRWMCVALEFA